MSTALNPGPSLSFTLSEILTHQSPPFSLSVRLYLYARLFYQPYIHHHKRESRHKRVQLSLYLSEKKSGYNSGEGTTLLNPPIQPKVEAQNIPNLKVATASESPSVNRPPR